MIIGITVSLYTTCVYAHIQNFASDKTSQPNTYHNMQSHPLLSSTILYYRTMRQTRLDSCQSLGNTSFATLPYFKFNKACFNAFLVAALPFVLCQIPNISMVADLASDG